MFEKKIKINNVLYDMKYNPSSKSWMYQELICQCGCGGHLIYNKCHNQNGIPKYIKNHYCEGPIAEQRKDEYKQWEKQFEGDYLEYKYQIVEDFQRRSSRGRVGVYHSLKTNTSLFYASSYEKRAMEILDTDTNIKTYSNCKFFINYTDPEKNKVHNYFPDISAEYETGEKKIIEIKSEYQVLDPKNLAKFAAAREYCGQNNLEFEVWTEKDLDLKNKGCG